MAKDQNLSLNPMKISGACGRLMCCLRYEHPLYEQFTAQMPAVGERVNTANGDGRVVAHDVPREQVVVALDGGGRCSCTKADICGSRKAFDAAHTPPAAVPAPPAPPDSPPTNSGHADDVASNDVASDDVASKRADNTPRPVTQAPVAPPGPSVRRRSRSRRHGGSSPDGGTPGT
jgi:hypothetical protein